MSRRRYGKLITGMCLLLLCMHLPGGRDVLATPIPDADISVNYEYETITVKTENDTVIYFTDSYSDNLAKWNVCEVRNKEASFDISWIKKTATVRLYLCGDVNTKVVSKDLGWQDKMDVAFTGTLLATDITDAEQWKNAYRSYPLFSEDTGYFIFTLEKDGRKNAYFDLDNVEWRKGDDGAWRSFDELDLKEMNIRGITLGFRIKAVNDATGTGGARNSTIAKLTVSKLNADPGVKLDTSQMEVGIRNGMEYSFDREHWILIPAYNRKAVREAIMVGESERAQAISELTTKTKVSSLLLHKLLGLKANAKLDKASFQGYAGDYEYNAASVADATGVYLYVRTAGTTRKAASKITKLLIPFTVAPGIEADADALEMEYLESKTATGGLLITNRSAYKYELAVLTPAEQIGIDWDDVDVSGLKWSSLPAGRVLKLAFNRLPKGSYLLYRIAGEDGRLPSTYVRSEQINYSEVTYADVARELKKVSEELTAVTSTNLSMDEVDCRWQRCANPKAENPVWENIVSGATYTISGADVGQYLRVVINRKGSNVSVASEPIGPITEK